MNIARVNRVVAILGSILIGIGLVGAAGTSVAGARAKVPLPSARDTIQARVRAEGLLRGGRGPERVLPGPVTDSERVLVALEADGTPRSVVVHQTLDLHGTGDYFFKVPGPVQDVEPLAESTGEPGLRSGSIVWQGFSNGAERLAARVVLVPPQEVDRLPLEATLEATVDGEPLDARHPASGDLVLRLTVGNATATPMALPSAVGVRSELTTALKSLHRVLAAHERPSPGELGVPRALTAVSSVRQSTQRVAAPLGYRVVLSVGGGAGDVRVSRGRATSNGAQVRGLLSGDKLEETTTFEVKDWTGVWPDVVVSMTPTPPAPSEAVVDGTRRQRGADPKGARAMFDTIMRVAAEAARLPDVDAYVGNPDPEGRARTSYIFRFIPPVDEAAVADAPRSDVPDAEGPNILAIVAAALGVFVLSGALIAWSLS